jgi:uncharacterized protein (TIGR02284 family)
VILNNLIETCKDGERGFQTAVDGVLNSDLKALFRAYAQQRAEYARELQRAVQRLGGAPENRGSLAATLHRGWINLKAVVTGQDEAAIIVECGHGEAAAENTYQEALKETLPAEIRTLVERQRAGIQEALSRLRALEIAASQA